MRASMVVGLPFAAAAAVPGAFVPDGLALDAHAPRPNVLIFLIDDMGYSDLAAFGSPNNTTPHLDSLVRSGVKLTQWISAASICTPSRAALQTGRYPIRTGCTGNTNEYRVCNHPAAPHGLDPAQHVSIATALKQAGYATGMGGKWHLGINGNEHMLSKPDNRFSPNAHGYDDYLGHPFTNAPMCEMNEAGVSLKIWSGPTYCFLQANGTVVQQPLKIENFTRYITDHAVAFIGRRGAEAAEAQAVGARPQPWYYFMSYFHVHTPLFTNRLNRGRSRGGEFGDNVEELDDSVGEVMAAVERNGFDSNTLIFMTSDNGPYQEEGWGRSGRANVYDDRTGALLGRLRGGKAQLYEGGIRVPGAVRWPGVLPAGTVTNTMVSSMDIFPTVLAQAGVDLGSSYTLDGRDMMPVLLGHARESQYDVFLHYCGFNIVAARVQRFKVFWKTQKWYTHDPMNASICLECCNGVIPASKVTGSKAGQLCGCEDKDFVVHSPPIVFDVDMDPMERHELSTTAWPADAGLTMEAVLEKAESNKAAMLKEISAKPDLLGAGTCTAGLPRTFRQPCCPGCYAIGTLNPSCRRGVRECSCDDMPALPPTPVAPLQTQAPAEPAAVHV